MRAVHSLKGARAGLAAVPPQRHIRVMAKSGATEVKQTRGGHMILGRSAASGRFVLAPVKSARASFSIQEGRDAARKVIKERSGAGAKR